jgi:hypothetical protein
MERKERELAAERERADELEERCERLPLHESTPQQGEEPNKGYFKEK